MTRAKLFAAFVLATSIPCNGQDRTVGLLLNNTVKTAPGYTLLPPLHSGRTYLIDNAGQVINTWDSKYEPGRGCYLLPNGHLLRAAMILTAGLSTGGGEGGRLEEYDWQGNLVWSFDYATPKYSLHHDFKMLPNGNILSLLVEVKSNEEMLAAGFRPDILQQGGNGSLQPDAVVEIKPIYPSGGQIVWEWHVWDHMVQNYAATKNNYGEPSTHPELIDPNSSYPRLIPAFWNHMNSIDYNPTLDQILLSVRGNSEVWVIDHSTTSAQAAAHAGGKRNKGGDLLYRWGNPLMYGAGKNTDEILYQQHDAQWIEAGLPGAGNMLVFNNGVGRPGGDASSVDEFTPAMDSSGNYPLTTGSAFGPSKLSWTYMGSGSEKYFDGDISGALRLPNGNTQVCWGTHGVIEEVTSAGEIVWKYVNPVVQAGPLLQGQSPGIDVQNKNESLNAVFNVRKYAPDFAAFTGKDMTPKGAIELTGTRFVNGASFVPGSTAPGAILTVVSDTTLSDGEASATTSSLPVKLAGTAAEIKDSTGTTLACSLYYVSKTQINLVVPDKAARGAATLTIRRDSGASTSGNITVDAVAPGLFSMGASGVGAMTGLRVSGSGQRSDVEVFRYDTAKAQFSSVPIDLGAATDQVYLSLYGTGFRGFSSTSALSASIAGAPVPVLGAAAQPQYAGLDQINIGPLPRNLAGKGNTNLVLRVDGKGSNTVTVSIK